MLKVFKTIVEINKQQQQISDRINKNSTNFNKEWDKWGTKKMKQEKRLP